MPQKHFVARYEKIPGDPKKYQASVMLRLEPSEDLDELKRSMYMTIMAVERDPGFQIAHVTEIEKEHFNSQSLRTADGKIWNPR
tara:strand:- start:602 stop:853 length:252 start_codon:yes stop_codon:yes gene_type:complete